MTNSSPVFSKFWPDGSVVSMSRNIFTRIQQKKTYKKCNKLFNFQNLTKEAFDSYVQICADDFPYKSKVFGYRVGCVSTCSELGSSYRSAEADNRAPAGHIVTETQFPLVL